MLDLSSHCVVRFYVQGIWCVESAQAVHCKNEDAHHGLVHVASLEDFLFFIFILEC